MSSIEHINLLMILDAYGFIIAAIDPTLFQLVHIP